MPLRADGAPIMKLGSYTQQPRERLPYIVSYAEALSSNDNVVTAEVFVTPVILDDNVAVDAQVSDPSVRFYFTGGVSGTTYKVTLLVTTRDGSVFEDEVIIKVKEL